MDPNQNEKSAVSFCSACGRRLADLGPLKFCPFCGATIGKGPGASARQPQSAGQQPAQPSPQAQYAAYRPPTPPPSGPAKGARPPGKTALIFGAAALAVVLIASIAILMLRGAGEKINPEALNGSWSVLLTVGKANASDQTAEALSALNGQSYRYVLSLELNGDGKGRADLAAEDGQEDIGNLTAQYRNGKLTLKSDGKPGFACTGKLNKGGDEIAGSFTLTAEGGDTLLGEMTGKKGPPAAAPTAGAAPPSAQPPTPVPQPTIAPTAEPEAVPSPTDAGEAPLGDILLGEWITESYADGTSEVFVFYWDGSCEEILTVWGDDSRMDGWKDGSWYAEEALYGYYTLVGDQLEIYLYSTDFGDWTRYYQIELIDRDTAVLYETYEGETYYLAMYRVVSSGTNA